MAVETERESQFPRGRWYLSFLSHSFIDCLNCAHSSWTLSCGCKSCSLFFHSRSYSSLMSVAIIWDILNVAWALAPVERFRERTEHLDIFSRYISFFLPSFHGVLFPMYCLLVEGECQILVFKIWQKAKTKGLQRRVRSTVRVSHN